MSQEAPKLYVNKPKKANLKQFQQQSLKEMGSATPTPATETIGSTTTSGGSGGGFNASKPPEPPRESFARRYKYLWPILLGVNLVVGAYIFTRTKKKELPVEEEASPTLHPSETSTTPAVEKPLPPPPTKPVKLAEPIPENQQRELFKWMLEEKRKIKPKDSEEKKRIDEEKAILKQFLRAKSIPAI